MNVTPGRLIRATRERAHLTQGQLAARCATAQSAISRLETDAVSPTVETLERILAAAGAELILTTHYPPKGKPDGT